LDSELDDLLDQLPPTLARKVARALSPDPDPDDEDEMEEIEVRPFLTSPGPCPVSWRYDPSVDSYPADS